MKLTEKKKPLDSTSCMIGFKIKSCERCYNVIQTTWLNRKQSRLQLKNYNDEIEKTKK